MSPQNTSELQINAELQAWIDPLTPEESAQLEANILAEGCRDPIVTWNGFILDGHNRYAICKRHGIDFATVEKAGLVTREDALVWMAQNQLGKRNLSDFTRVALALRLKPLLEQRAQQRMMAGRALDNDPAQKSAEGSGETREALAKVAGVSRDTVGKVEKIIGSGDQEVIDKVRAGELSINAAAKKVAPPRTPAPTAAPQPSPQADTPDGPPTSSSPVQQVLDQQAIPGASTAEFGETAKPKMIEVEEESYFELIRNFEQALADNAEMGRVFDADDRLQAAQEEIKRYKVSAASAKQSLDSKMGENAELIRTVKRLTRDVERERKRADAAEQLLANMRAAA